MDHVGREAHPAVTSRCAAGHGPDEANATVSRTAELAGCRVTLRRVDGPVARELFLHCRPPDSLKDAGQQAEAVYRGLLDLLAAEGAEAGALVSETVCCRRPDSDLEPIREARRRVLDGEGASIRQGATLEIGLAPLNDAACLEVMAHAVVPAASAGGAVTVSVESETGFVEGLLVRVGRETRFHAAGLGGSGADVYAQTLNAFELAEGLLEKAGMAFRDVVRTWIHFRDIDRDYADFNRARRRFFQDRGIDPVPASTGIGGAPVSPGHDLALTVQGVRAEEAPERTVMTSPTLNEAMQYGADFVRGLKVAGVNQTALHVSGTASIDEAGRTVHAGDLDAQVERMLVNIAALLERQGAGFGDVVSAITYLKHPEDAGRLGDKLRDGGFEGFPHALVAAPICRPELLCETEVLAALPIPGRTSAGAGQV